jgi:NAD(P)-dependent dehydrogenase (short-subunit alcohol dehydrogenase family)
MAAALPRAALVTGAARPLGAALARMLAGAGWRVAAQDTSAEGLALLAGESGAQLLAAELAREDEAESLIPRAVAAVGPLGLLVNGASICGDDSMVAADRASWDRHLAVNLRAPLVLSRAFAGQLQEGGEGVIVNLLGDRTHRLRTDRVADTISTAGLWSLTRVLALELAPRVRVNGIGGITERGEDAAMIEDGVAALRFLLATPGMTGQMINLAGKARRRRPMPGGSPQT